jgi:hypothetical protein
VRGTSEMGHACYRIVPHICGYHSFLNHITCTQLDAPLDIRYTVLPGAEPVKILLSGPRFRLTLLAEKAEENLNRRRINARKDQSGNSGRDWCEWRHFTECDASKANPALLVNLDRDSCLANPSRGTEIPTVLDSRDRASVRMVICRQG